MKALLGHMPCGGPGWSLWPSRAPRALEVALGEDGNLYPINEELAERIETYEAAVELGFSVQELLSDEPDDCLQRWFEFQPRELLWQRDVLPIRLLGVIATRWIDAVSENFHMFKYLGYPCGQVPECFALAAASIEGEEWVSLPMLKRCERLLRVCGGGKARQDIDENLLHAVGSLTDLALDIKQWQFLDHARSRVNRISMAVEEVSLGGSPSSWYKTREVAQYEQVAVAVETIDAADAWNVELEV